MVLRIVTAILLSIWILLVVVGKGGFVHLLLLSAMGCGVVELTSIYRSRLTVRDADKL